MTKENGCRDGEKFFTVIGAENNRKCQGRKNAVKQCM